MGEIQEEKIAEFCGAVIGDGWIQSNEKGFFLAGDPLEDREYYDSHITPMVKDILIETKPREFPYWKVYGISLYKKKHIKKLRSFGLPKGKKVDTAEVPSWIRNSNKKIKSAFVRGVFDTDGCIFCQKDYTKYANTFNAKYHVKARLRFTSISKNLIEQVMDLMKGLGFRCSKRRIKRGFSNDRNNHDVFILELNKLDGIKRFFEELKPSNPRHVTKYLIWKKFGFCPPKTTISQRKDILKNVLNPYELY